MDWRAIINEADTLATLSAPEAEERLSHLRSRDPDAFDAVRRLARRHVNGHTFMRTSADGAAPDMPGLDAGDHIGVWRIENLIDAGGMGEVYRAERADGLYEQTVALKLIRGRLSGSQAAAFDRERERLARLDHPGVTRIIDGGSAPDGRPFMVMEFVNGQPIDRHCEEHGGDRKARLALMAELCRAVSHAHARLVLHCDIKASNVLVNAEGHVKLIDFGIASLLDEDDAAGPGPMTLATAAPEQLFGEPVGAATDVFGLGVLTHLLLTGRLPERRDDGGVAIDQPGIGHRDLAAIVERATAVSPQDRYASADALMIDILAFLNTQPVSARGGGRGYRIGKYLQRYPLTVSAASIAIIALISGLAASLMFAQQANANLARAEHALTNEQRSGRVSDMLLATLNRVFADEAGEARVRELLLERVEEAHAQRDRDRESAALVAYAVGRTFVTRNDFTAAAEALEPWLNEEYGDPTLVNLGKYELALALRFVDGGERSLALLREVEPEFSTPLNALSAAHVNTVYWIALLTNDPAELRRARELFFDQLATDPPLETQTLAWHSIARLSERLLDYDGAYEAARRLVALDEAHFMGSVESVLTDRSLLAWYEVNWRRDLDAAQALLEKNLADGAEFPNQPFMADTYFLLTEVAVLDGRFDDAERHYEQWREVYLAANPGSPTLQVGHVELMAERGKFAEAEAAIQTMIKEYAAAGYEGWPHRAVLAQAYVALKRDGAQAASEVLRAHNFAREEAGTKIASVFRFDRLVSMGVTPPAVQP